VDFPAQLLGWTSKRHGLAGVVRLERGEARTGSAGRGVAGKGFRLGMRGRGCSTSAAKRTRDRTAPYVPLRCEVVGVNLTPAQLFARSEAQPFARATGHTVIDLQRCGRGFAGMATGEGGATVLTSAGSYGGPSRRGRRGMDWRGQAGPGLVCRGLARRGRCD
jgi:hypothetical protein